MEKIVPKIVTPKNPWQELWVQLEKEEKKEFLITTAKQRYILTTIATILIISIFSPCIIFAPFTLILIQFISIALERQLQKNLTKRYSDRLDPQEMADWIEYINTPRTMPEGIKKHLQQVRKRNKDSFHNPCSTTTAGTPAYRRTH